MKSSKIITVPEFSKLPKSEAADVKENIDNWLNTNQNDKIEKFLRPSSKGYRGWRFVDSSDFKEERNLQWVFNRTLLNVKFIRYAKSHHFTPLWFILDRIEIWITIGDDTPFRFRSDADLKKRIVAYKKAKSQLVM